MSDSLKQLIVDFEKQQSEFQEKVKAEIGGLFKQVFEEIPSLTQISWTQYAPYFNDGDECTFNVHTPSFCTKAYTEALAQEHDEYELEDMHYEEIGVSFWSSYESDWTRSEVKKAGLTPDEAKTLIELSNIITSSTMEPIMRSAFGEHVLVKVTAEQIEVEEYEHD